MKKFKSMLFAFAFFTALAAAFAFNLPVKDAKTFTVYHYTSDSDELTDMQNVANWEATGPTCDIDGNVPCTLSFEGDETALAAHLGEFDNVQDILTEATARRDATK